MIKFEVSVITEAEAENTYRDRDYSEYRKIPVIGPGLIQLRKEF